jgi:hypothetical protein
MKRILADPSQLCSDWKDNAELPIRSGVVAATPRHDLTTRRLKREYPHHVALAAGKVRGLDNSAAVRSVAASLDAAQLTCHLPRDDGDFVVFCFPHKEDARNFARRFGGERLQGYASQIAAAARDLRQVGVARRLCLRRRRVRPGECPAGIDIEQPA